MNTLYINTHETKSFSVGFFNQELKIEKGSDTSLEIVEKVDKITLNNIDEIIIITGPGSLTGLRIGSSFAQGLALGKKIKILGVSIWDLILLEHPEADIIFYTGTVKWVKKNQSKEVICEKADLAYNKKWISNKADLLNFDKNDMIKFPNSEDIIKLMHKHKSKSSENIDLLYPITLFQKNL